MLYLVLHPIFFILLYLHMVYPHENPFIHNKVIIFLGTFGFSRPSSRPSCAQTNRAVTPSSLACHGCHDVP